MEQNKKQSLERYSKFLDGTDHHLTYAALSVYLNDQGELSQKEKAFLERHLARCPVCAERQREVEEVEREQSRTRRPEGIRREPVFRYAIAAMLVLAAGSVLILSVLNRSHEELQSNGSAQISTTDPLKFVPNPMLENFVERTVRGTAGVQWISPGSGDTVTIPITFRWSDGRKGRTFTLILLDNAGKEVWRDSTSTMEGLLSEMLGEGLYYAKLEADGVLERVSKFTLLKGP